MSLENAFQQPSMVMRIAIGKGIGFVVGLIGFVIVPAILPDAGSMFRWAMLLWYTTFGAIIGVYGVFTYHPVLKLPMPWWFRAPIIGAWLNFVLTLFIYDELAAFMTAMFGTEGSFSSPFLFVLEGAVFGLMIGYMCTRYGGEGKETVRDQEAL